MSVVRRFLGRCMWTRDAGTAILMRVSLLTVICSVTGFVYVEAIWRSRRRSGMWRVGMRSIAPSGSLLRKHLCSRYSRVAAPVRDSRGFCFTFCGLETGSSRTTRPSFTVVLAPEFGTIWGHPHTEGCLRSGEQRPGVWCQGAWRRNRTKVMYDLHVRRSG